MFYIGIDWIMLNMVPVCAEPLVRVLERHWYSRKECLILKPLTVHIANGDAEAAECCSDHTCNLTLGCYVVICKFVTFFALYKCWLLSILATINPITLMELWKKIKSFGSRFSNFYDSMSSDCDLPHACAPRNPRLVAINLLFVFRSQTGGRVR